MIILKTTSLRDGWHTEKLYILNVYILVRLQVSKDLCNLWASLKVKHFWGPISNLPYYHGFSSQGPHPVHMAKIREELSVLGRKRGKINILKYAQCFLHDKGLPFRSLVHPGVGQLGNSSLLGFLSHLREGKEGWRQASEGHSPGIRVH